MYKMAKYGFDLNNNSNFATHVYYGELIAARVSAIAVLLEVTLAILLYGYISLTITVSVYLSKYDTTIPALQTAGAE